MFVELMAERGANAFETRKRKLPVSVEGDRVCVIVVCNPFDDRCALLAFMVRVIHTA